MLATKVAGLLDQIDDLVLVVDTAWRISYANAAARRELGGAALDGRDLWRVLDEPMGAALRVQCQLALVDRQPVNFEAYNQARQAHYSVSVYPTDDGVTLMLRDVSDQHRAEAQLARVRRALQTIVDASPLALCVVDADGRVQLWNPAAEALFGWTRAETIGEVLPTVASEQMPEFRDNLRRTLRGAVLSGQDVTRRHKDGRPIDVTLWTAPLHDGGGQATTALCIMADVTRRKAAEADLRRARDAAEQANQTKDNFLAMLSHELRTPLMPVSAAVAELLAAPDLPAVMREDLETVQRNVDLQARLMDDLLDLTRISRGKLHLRCETVALRSLIEQTIELCAGELAGKQLQVETALDAAECYVRADRARLQQVFWNLIKNAVKFTPQRGFVRISAEQAAPGRVLVYVTDSGIGIAAEALTHIFDPYEQGQAGTARTYGGLGLGLAISRALAQLHGGFLTGQSPGRNRGSTFTVDLPTVEAPLPAELAPRAPATPARAQRILLVEDHRDTARLMARVLTSMGHEVAVAHDVMSALRVAGEGEFDLLISDIGLPDGSGVELMRELRKTTSLRGIALSGFGMEDDIRRCKDAGFAEHLVKPVNLQTLEQLINQLAGDPV